MAKQVCDIKSTKGIAAADSKEQTRDWSRKQMELRMANKNLNYDFTRTRLNFEVVDGEIKEVDKRKTLDESIRENLKRRGIPHPEDSKSHVKKGAKEPEKMVRNIAARMILGGSTERMNEIAFGDQKVDFTKGAENPNVTRSEDIEKWAKDEYAYLENMYGKGSVARFIVHLDESWVHAHATVIPTAMIKGKERVSWRQVFGGSLDVSRPKWKKILDEHYEQVGMNWRLDRGDPVLITGAKNRSTRDYNKDLMKENARLVQKNATLTTDVANLESEKKNISQDKNELQQQYNNLKQQYSQLSDEHAELVKQTNDVRENLTIITSSAEQLNREMGKNIKAMKSLASMIENKMTERAGAIQNLHTAQTQRDSGIISAEQYEAVVAETNAKIDEFDKFIKGKTDRLTDVGIQLAEKQTQLNQLHTDYDTLLMEVGNAKKFKKDNAGLMKRAASFLSNTMTEHSLLETAKRLNAIPDGQKVEGLSELANVLKIFAEGYPKQIENAKDSGYKLGYTTRSKEVEPDVERLRSTVTSLGATAQQTQNMNLSALITWLEKLAAEREAAIKAAREEAQAKANAEIRKLKNENNTLKSDNSSLKQRNQQLEDDIEVEKTANVLLNEEVKRQKLATDKNGHPLTWTSGPNKGKQLTNKEYQKWLSDQFETTKRELKEEKIAREQERQDNKNEWITHKRHMRELKGMIFAIFSLDARKFVDIIINHWKGEMKDFARDVANDIQVIIFGAESTLDKRKLFVSDAFAWAKVFAELEMNDEWKPDYTKLEPLKEDASRIADGTWEKYHSNNKQKKAAVKAVASLANTPNPKYYDKGDIKAVNDYLNTVPSSERNTAIKELRERAAEEYTIKISAWLDNVITKIKSNSLDNGQGLTV